MQIFQNLFKFSPVEREPLPVPSISGEGWSTHVSIPDVHVTWAFMCLLAPMCSFSAFSSPSPTLPSYLEADSSLGTSLVNVKDILPKRIFRWCCGWMFALLPSSCLAIQLIVKGIVLEDKALEGDKAMKTELSWMGFMSLHPLPLCHVMSVGTWLGRKCTLPSHSPLGLDFGSHAPALLETHFCCL